MEENELQQVLDNILEDKTTNLKPENLKQGVTCLGIEGSLDSEGVTQLSIHKEDILETPEGVTYPFTLNSDGTATFDGTNKYFRVENYNFGQGVDDNYYPAIIFSDTKDGNAGPNVYTPYVSTPDCLMTDGELECVTYVG